METQIIKYDVGNSGQSIRNGSLSNDQPNSSAIYSSDVIVEIDVTTHTSGSSAVFTRNITNYPWEQIYLPGNLVAVHCSENFIAYAIKAPKTCNGMVRVISRRTGARGLIKNIPGLGLIKDLAFAYLTSRILLGFIDQYGTVFVYEIHEEADTLRTDRLLEIKRNNADQSEYQRLIWCPYIPDEEEEQESDDDNFAFLLVATNGPVAVIWHIGTLIQEQNRPTVVDPTNDKIIAGRHYVMEQHSAPIIDAAYSPDGTALATAALDGFVKFFQVYLSDDENPPRCLHEWNPHNGKPLSCLFFLDNHRNPPSPEVQFWKYALTGACNNTEIKLWSCDTWKCNQTLTFQSTSKLCAAFPQHALKAAIDPSSKYLLLSDIYRRVLYVVMLCQEAVSSSNGMDPFVGISGTTRIFSLTELPIQFPILSLSITNAEWKPYKKYKPEHLLEDSTVDCYADDDGPNDNMDVVEGLVIKSVLINTQSLQDATICFQPALDSSSLINNILSPVIETSSSQEESFIIRDGLTDLSITGNLSSSLDLLKQQSDLELEENSSNLLLTFPPAGTPSGPPTGSNIAASLNLDVMVPVTNAANVTESVTMNLLTPESFSSPGRVEETTPIKIESNLVDLEKMTAKTTSPCDDLKNAAMSLLLRSGQSTNRRSKTPESINILDSVVSGSRVSPTMISLPPPPKNEPMSIKEEAPLATSEVSVVTSVEELPQKPTEVETAPLVAGNWSPAAPLVAGSAAPLVAGNWSPAAPLVAGNAAPLVPGSSTSSPSLEVQQILHSHNDKHYKSDEEERDEFRQPVLIDLALPSAKEAIPDLPSAKEAIPRSLSFPISPLPAVSKSFSSIPSISVVSTKGNSKNRSLQALMNLTSNVTTEKMEPSASHLMNMIGVMKPFNCSDLESELLNRKHSSAQQNGTEQQLYLHADVKELQNVCKKTQKDLESLKSVIYDFNGDHDRRMGILMERTTQLAEQFDKSLKVNQQIKKHLEDFQKSQNKMVEKLPNIVTSNVGPLIESIVRQEIRAALNPALNRCFDPLRMQLSSEMRAIVNGSETFLSETFTKTLTSRNFVDGISASVSSVLTTGVQNACRESYNKIVLPGLNTVTAQVFSQLNDAFTRGTKEYMHYVETESQNTRQSSVDALNKTTKSLENSASSLSSHAGNLVDSLDKNTALQTSLSNTLGERLSEMVHSEVGRALREHQATVEARCQHSRAQTPTTTPSVHNPKLAQQQVQLLISQSQFNLAFKQALSASDLSLVVFVCERINPQQLFNQTPCLLSQDVLLSLVNQLSHDLTTFTDLKTKYLEESIMNLDMTHPITREHVKTVLEGLEGNLNNYVSLHPNHKKLKMLLMAVKHLVSSSQDDTSLNLH